MKPKTNVEQRKAEIIKTVRALVRLRYSIAADRELSTRLPELTDWFDDQVTAGNLPNVSDALEAVLSQVNP